MTRWVAAGGLAVAGVFALAVAKVHPGKAASTSVSTGTSTGAAGSAPTGSSNTGSSNTGSSNAGQTGGTETGGVSSPSTGGLQAPVQLPQARRGRASVSSGGS